ncbi:MAG: chromosomal replication initiator protein DnaA [Capnocytophaga ochracea]|jgi:chromosomal replication initiator protein dnaA|uniref:Chromosomal replication initiator protein DnaA n=1 Tax=Capnocytophaga ochracea TaxID=1018 RepID=A0A2X2R762_CAPOC|nr:MULTISPECIES: chromosomal replication initiator protein DnaA [Capnocytophaga]ALC96547.1 chromosomal replication initiation protein [Capnocytophaga sp. oral taxon 323]EJF36530.1 chromosomal replication initiator protein DnaA [Capnocytophaga sp. oral taxon 335 str. F0486]EKY08287.1 replication initiator protein DnaA [Capnocytophaga sp. oral taxon 380 str. F0488]EKY13736.1 replication initiator protein DnaA [Capnocytophaga sp. oral taxon 324 str. F0483]UZD37841.1 chromosomal replication initia
MKEAAEKVWSRCLEFIKDNITEQPFNTWFAPIVPVELEGNTLKIKVPSKFFCEWLEENYISLLKSAMTFTLGVNSRLVYIVDTPLTKEQLPSTNRPELAKQTLTLATETKDPGLKNPFVIPGIREITVDPQLNLHQNFDNFVEGASNRLARSAGMAVANKPGGTAFNPLFIFGGVGLGKTHLAHAIGVDIKEKYPKKKVLYVSAEKFTQQFISASTAKDKDKNTLNDFIHFYQLIDVLIVDDIQFLSGKVKTQDAFFHIFNHLHQNGKQVILTSDKAPVDLFDIEQRLLSRFKWGLSAELQTPDYETRYKILENKFYNDGAEIGEDIIAYLAENIRTNVRELEGVSNSLIAQAAFNRKEYSIELAQSIIDKSVKNNRNDLTIDHIQQIIADYFGLDIESLHSKTRKRNVVQARQLAMFFSKKYTKNSLSTIGSQIGQRDHATVLHACKTVENLIETDRAFKKYVSDLETKFSD